MSDIVELTEADRVELEARQFVCRAYKGSEEDAESKPIAVGKSMEELITRARLVCTKEVEVDLITAGFDCWEFRRDPEVDKALRRLDAERTLRTYGGVSTVKSHNE